jgi:hypothetical protein
MNKILSLSLLLFYALNTISQTEETKILFLGNSLTKYKKNQMTDILQKFIDESNSKTSITVLATNGARLSHHTQTIMLSKKRGMSYGVDTVIATSMKIILNNNFDKIIIQDPDWLILKRRIDHLYPSIRFIDSLTSSKILFYEKVPSFIEPRTFCYGCGIKYTKHAPDSIKKPIIKIKYETIEEQIDSIKKVGFEITGQVAKGSSIIPTGEIIYRLSKKYPNELMTIEGEHPSKVVQFTLALTFYTYLTKNDPRKLKYNFKINQELAEEIKSDVYSYFRNIELIQ